MRRILLLVGFVAHLCVGSMCFAQIAYAKLDVAGQPEQIEAPISLRDATTCPAMRQVQSTVKQEEPTTKGGCPDGRCFKAGSPTISNISQTIQTVEDAATLPVPIFSAHDLFVISVDDCVATSLDDPPIPPGVATVVMRE